MKKKSNKSESDCQSPILQAFEVLLKEAFPDAWSQQLFCQTLLNHCHSHLIEQTDQLERRNDRRSVIQGVDVQKDGVKTNSETFAEQFFRASYAISTHPESDKTELTVWENGTAATIEINQDQLSQLIEGLSHCVR